MSRRHWPVIPSAWTAWTFAGRQYRREPDGIVKCRRSARFAWVVSAQP